MTSFFNATITYIIVALLGVFTLGYISEARASSAVFSGEDLLKMCNSTYDTDYGMCAGYVSAITHALLQESVGGHRACNHQMVRSQQVIEIFRSYTEMFPESLSQEAPTAVAGSLARAFPCRN